MARAKEQQRLLNYNVAEARNKLLTMKALNMNPSVKVEDTDEYKRIESDMKKAESVQEFAKNMQNEDFRKQYAEYEQHQKDYENKNWLGKTAEQVGNAIADVLYSIGSGAYGVAESVSGVADSVLGRNPNEGGTLSKTFTILIITFTTKQNADSVIAVTQSRDLQQTSTTQLITKNLATSQAMLSQLRLTLLLMQA